MYKKLKLHFVKDKNKKISRERKKKQRDLCVEC